jgi:hypothetical protein
MEVPYAPVIGRGALVLLADESGVDVQVDAGVVAQGEQFRQVGGRVQLDAVLRSW